MTVLKPLVNARGLSLRVVLRRRDEPHDHQVQFTIMDVSAFQERARRTRADWQPKDLNPGLRPVIAAHNAPVTDWHELHSKILCTKDGEPALIGVFAGGVQSFLDKAAPKVCFCADFHGSSGMLSTLIFDVRIFDAPLPYTHLWRTPSC
jgi:hypothetical protein